MFLTMKYYYYKIIDWFYYKKPTIQYIKYEPLLQDDPLLQYEPYYKLL
jgi:hypothetical protein